MEICKLQGATLHHQTSSSYKELGDNRIIVLGVRADRANHVYTKGKSDYLQPGDIVPFLGNCEHTHLFKIEKAFKSLEEYNKYNETQILVKTKGPTLTGPKITGKIDLSKEKFTADMLQTGDIVHLRDNTCFSVVQADKLIFISVLGGSEHYVPELDENLCSTTRKEMDIMRVCRPSNPSISFMLTPYHQSREDNEEFGSRIWVRNEIHIRSVHNYHVHMIVKLGSNILNKAEVIAMHTLIIYHLYKLRDALGGVMSDEEINTYKQECKSLGICSFFEPFEVK